MAPSYHVPDVLCAGLACLDMELLGCAAPPTPEAIARYARAAYAAGGCAPQAARALSVLGLRAAATYPAADDAHGNTLRTLLAAADVDARPVGDAAGGDGGTALAVLPVFRDGGRGCFVSLGANETVTQRVLVPDAMLCEGLRALHVGYPHLLPHVQGGELAALLRRVWKRVPAMSAVSLDVNGADQAEEDALVLTAALPHVTLLHANLEEACAISGLARAADAPALARVDVERVVRWMVLRAFSARGEETGDETGGTGAALSPIVCVTCGKHGVFVGRAEEGLQVEILHRKTFAVTKGTEINSSGAGDAFAAGTIAGFLCATKQGHTPRSVALETVANAGLLSARAALDPTYRMAVRSDFQEDFLASAATATRVPSRFESVENSGSGVDAE